MWVANERVFITFITSLAARGADWLHARNHGKLLCGFLKQSNMKQNDIAHWSHSIIDETFTITPLYRFMRQSREPVLAAVFPGFPRANWVERGNKAPPKNRKVETTRAINHNFTPRPPRNMRFAVCMPSRLHCKSRSMINSTEVCLRSTVQSAS